MFKLTLAVVISSLISNICATYSGPFLFFGLNELKDIEKSALENLDDKLLRDLYTDSTAVVVFLKNATTKLSNDNFPTFKSLIDKHAWLYLPQQSLSADPLDYNVNAEVINLVGSPEQQDIELAALYRDAVMNYGDRKVLGILASRWDDNHAIKKRETTDKVSTTTEISVTPAEEVEQNDYVYISAGKAIFYTTTPPTLRTPDEESELKSHGVVFVDDRVPLFRLGVTLIRDDGSKLTLRFRFEIAQGSWEMNSVELEESSIMIMNLVGQAPSAPLGFSYKCTGELLFQNGSNSVTIKNYQVQPLLGGSSSFGPAIDCVDFTTAPIWAGVFVSFLLLFVISIGISAILDIKPPNRFENRSGKQLTFAVGE